LNLFSVVIVFFLPTWKGLGFAARKAALLAAWPFFSHEEFTEEEAGMARTRLTEALKKSIVAAAQAMSDFDAVTEATGASKEDLDSWIHRGARQKTGIYRELLDELKPFLPEMWRRQFWTIQARFFSQLGAMAARDKRFERILTVWFNAIWLNDGRVPKARRLQLASQLIKSLGRRPIHSGRWRFLEMKKRLARLSDSQIKELMLSAVFVAADILERERPEYPPPALQQIFDGYQGIRRLIGNLLTEDVAGPGWRKKEIETEYKDEGSHPAVDAQFAKEAQFRKGEELRQFVLQRLAMLTRKTPDQVAGIIDRHRPKDISELAERLGTTRLALYRKLITPTRKGKS
jgi:hypothetical protein